MAGGLAAYPDRYARAAGRVHRGVGDRNADQVNQGERQADGHARKARWRQLVGGPQNHHQKEKREHDFDQQGGAEAVATRGVGPEAVGGQGIGPFNHKPGASTGHQLDHPAGEYGAYHLGHDVGKQQ